MRIDGVPGGEYDVHLWHYAQATAQAPQAMRLRGEDSHAAAFSLPLKAMPTKPPPT